MSSTQSYEYPSNSIINASNLPVAQLESLKSRCEQIIESIQALQQLLLEADVRTGDSRRINNVISGAMGSTTSAANENTGRGGQHGNGGSGMMALAMPSWPDILAKYNLLLSQTQTLQNALVGASISSTSTNNNRSGNTNNNIGVYADIDTKKSSNIFARIALHPASPMSDIQLDNGLAPLLRNQQTMDVLKKENDLVKRINSRLTSSQANYKKSAERASANANASPNYAAIIQECNEIRQAHDSRCERALRAVMMLREKYDWKARVAVETEEPEEFVPLSPTLNIPLSIATRTSVEESGLEGGDTPMTGSGSGESGEDGDEDEEEVLEEVLGPSVHSTPSPTGGTPGQIPMEIS